MYIAVGKTKSVYSKDIIGIFDLDITSQSHITRKYLNISEKEGCVINEAEDLPKTFIVCSENNKKKIYLSQITSSTLTKRVE